MSRKKRSRKATPRKQFGLFADREYKYLANKVKMKNPEEAKKSVKDLRKEFDKAKDMDKKTRVWRATDEAKKIADAQLKRKNLSAKERKEFEAISKIYDKEAKQMNSEMSDIAELGSLRKSEEAREEWLLKRY